MVGQCQLALRDVNPFEENQIHTLTVSENIEVSDTIVTNISHSLYFSRIRLSLFPSGLPKKLVLRS